MKNQVIKAHFSKGFRFKVVKSGLIGIITSEPYDWFGKTCYGVEYFENDEYYMTSDVFEFTIIANLKYGVYVEL